MNVLAIPIGDRLVASSRIRLFSLLDALKERLKYTVYDRQVDPDLSSYDIVYVQKAAWKPICELCKRAIQAGLKIVYDIDDDFGCWPDMQEEEMCAMASLVIVDTVERKELVEKVTKAPVGVIPCMIDFADSAERNKPFIVRDTIRNLCTFGNRDSIEKASLHFRKLAKEHLETVVIGPQSVRDRILHDRFIEFEMSSFLRDLKANDIILLCHGMDDCGSRKDNNRLILAMSLGIPTITSDTKAYRDTLNDAGLPELVCRSPQDLVRILSKLKSPAHRAEVSDRFVQYAWANYSPGRCADMFGQLLAKAGAI